MPSAPHAHPLAYELGQHLRTGRYIPHGRQTRILVAGSGAFEALVVARVHPSARVTAVDLSAASLRILKRRAWLAGVSRRLACVQADLHEDLSARLGAFDYIVCTGVIHHTPEPELLLSRLVGLLAPGGVLRLMTYAENSRQWIYEVRRWFEAQGLAAPRMSLRWAKELARQCRARIAELPELHPVRTTFENYSDARDPAGLIDGFFHACDKPIPVPALGAMCARQHLSLCGFGHAWHSQPNALRAALSGANAPASVLARFDALGAWERLALLDDLGELAVNPVLWLAREMEDVAIGTPAPGRLRLNPALSRARMRASLPAPLMPLQPGELIASATPAQAQDAMAGSTAAALDRFLEAGWVLGNEGLLPEALARNRARPYPSHTDDERRTADSGIGAVASDTIANDATPTAQERQLAGLRRALATLGPEALPLLRQILEPRIDRRGRELPGLSSAAVLDRLA